MYLRPLLVLKSTVISTLGLAAMNSLMNPRRMTTTSLSTVCTITFEYPFEMIFIWYTIRLSAFSRTLFTTPESYILVWPAPVITFLVTFVTQYWCFHELELTNFQIMNSFSLVLFISSVRNDWQHHWCELEFHNQTRFADQMIQIFSPTLLEIWLKAQCIDRSRYQFFEHCKILPSLLFCQWLIKKNQMLNHMKVKEPETWLSQTSRSQLRPSSIDFQCMPDHL